DCPVEHCVADDDVFGRLASRLGRLAHDQPSARETLTGVVIGVAMELQRDAMGKKGAKALPGITAERRPDRVLRQAGMTIAARDPARQHRPDSPMDVSDGP